MSTETRGSHDREKYAECNNDEWIACFKIRPKEHGSMQLIKHPIDRG